MRAWSLSLCVSLVLVSMAAGCCKSKSEESPPVRPVMTPAHPATTVAAPTTPPTPAVPVEPYKVGERIRVEWKGDCYAARILRVTRPGAYFITYEGYDHSWDETITKARICSPKR